MEKSFIKRLIIVMTISMLFLLALGNYFIKESVLKEFKNTSQVQIEQFLQILAFNKKEIETLRDITREDYLNKAWIFAHMIENNPELADDSKELENLASIMQIDEIHIFNEQGVITAGSISNYIGFGVNDGEQIGYFKQILEDPTLELVQEILPATADKKLMQYAAISRKDKKGIVQIGMRPERMLNVLYRNNLSYVFSNIVIDKNKVIALIDKKTGFVKGVSSNGHNKLNFSDVSFAKQMIQNSEANKYIEVSHPEYFAIIFETENKVICITKNKNFIMDSIKNNIFILLISLIFIGFFTIFAIRKLLEHHVIFGIKTIITDLKEITSGNLDTVISVNNNPEFKKLSQQLNMMVGYLLRSTSKISRIIDMLDINIAIYEYEKNTKKVIATNRLASILGFTYHEEEELFKDKNLFENKINLIRQSFQDKEDNMIYYLLSPKGNKYIKIKTFNDFDRTMGIVIDVTDDVLRRNIIMHERDYDVLSELYNRRAFIRETDCLFSHIEKMNIACVVMFDMDNLKTVNDQYGHHCGDKYIKAGAEILRLSHEDKHTIISRLSGDEFVMILYGYENQEQIIEKIQTIYERMLKTSILINETLEYPVKFSGGYSFYPEHSMEKATLLKLADTAMYHAKQNNRSTFIRYYPEMEMEVDS